MLLVRAVVAGAIFSCQIVRVAAGRDAGGCHRVDGIGSCAEPCRFAHGPSRGVDSIYRAASSGYRSVDRRDAVSADHAETDRGHRRGAAGGGALLAHGYDVGGVAAGGGDWVGVVFCRVAFGLVWHAIWRAGDCEGLSAGTDPDAGGGELVYGARGGACAAATAGAAAKICGGR